MNHDASSTSAASIGHNSVHALEARTVRRQTIEATVVRACRGCGAAGQQGWAKCPHCGADRPPDEPKGLLWEKVFTA